MWDLSGDVEGAAAATVGYRRFTEQAKLVLQLFVFMLGRLLLLLPAEPVRTRDRGGAATRLTTEAAGTRAECRLLSLAVEMSCYWSGALWALPGAACSAEATPSTLTQLTLDMNLQASSLSRLRHPCILEMAEPMEETRFVCLSFR